jgi:hypothetical protein
MSILQSDIASLAGSAIPGGSVAMGIAEGVASALGFKDNNSEAWGYEEWGYAIAYDHNRNIAGNMLRYAAAHPEFFDNNLGHRHQDFIAKADEFGVGVQARQIIQALFNQQPNTVQNNAANTVYTATPTPDATRTAAKTTNWIPIVAVLVVVLILAFVVMSKGKK